ncbi:MAG: PA3496 family putative envelope integrity protein [Gammaproteobacteria bacterium]
MKHHIDHEEHYTSSEFGDDVDYDPADSKRKMEIKRKLEERMEKRRLKQELEDYEGELDADFDWDEHDK